MKNNPVRDLALVRALGCQWIGAEQDPEQGLVTYCGCHELHKDTVYCADHHPLMYQKGTALRKRRKERKIADGKLALESLFNEAVLELTAEGIL